MNTYKLILTALFSLGLISTITAQIVPCEAGMAGVYPCDKVDLLSVVPLSDIGNNISGSDIWGWTDPLDGNEYVLFGVSSGTAFYDIADPVNPVYLGFLPTHSSNILWRDVKVYDNHAFIVSESNNHGMQVFDLTRLRNVANPPETFTEDGHYDGFGDAHNLVINEEVGMAYAVGTDFFQGGLFIVDISDPVDPILAGSYSDDGYTHDAQVVTYNGPDLDYVGRQIAFNCNEDDLTIVDVSDPTDTQTLSSTGYDDSEYAHQGWLTEDHKYFLLGDELDEANNSSVNLTRTYIWDVQDLNSPVLLSFHEGTSGAIDHNMYTRGEMLFQSNYSAGLRILDLRDVENANLTETAYFDVFPANNNTSFDGTWSNYPYFASGVIPVSDFDSGLFLVRPKFLNAIPSSIEACNSDDIVFDLIVEQGFYGPVNLSVEDLPSGASVSFSSNGVQDNSTVQVTISNLAGIVGSFDISLVGDNGEFVYRDVVSLEILGLIQMYADADEDGYGSSNSADFIMSCYPVEGYLTTSGDCDDTRNDVFPGAPGTMEGIDNDCNDIIEEDELLPGCPEDVNNDGQVNILDLVVISSNFGCNTGNCEGDANNDGNTNILDLVAVSSSFGSDCQ